MKTSSAFKFAVMALWVIAAASQAQMPDFSPAIEIASGSIRNTDFVLNPAIAADPSDGAIYVVYADFKDRQDVWLRKVTVQTPSLKVSDPTNISNTEKLSIQPEVAAYNGRVCVAWQDGEPGMLEIFVACSNDGGATFNPGVNVSNSPDVDSGVIFLSSGPWDGNLDIAIGPDKNVYVVWADDRDLKFSKSADGKVFSEPVMLPQGTSDVRYPHIAIGNDGAIYVAYNEAGEQASDVFILRSTDGGNTFSPEPVNATNNNGFSDAAELAIDAQNVIYVVNDDTTTNPNNADINFSVSTDAGANFQDKGAIAKDGAFPSIATDGKNLFVVFWDIANPRRLPLGFVYSTDGGAAFTRKDIPNSADNYGFVNLDEDFDIIGGGINISDPEVAATPATEGSSGVAYIVWAAVVRGQSKIFLTTFQP
jgi:hypothetical protein